MILSVLYHFLNSACAVLVFFLITPAPCGSEGNPPDGHAPGRTVVGSLAVRVHLTYSLDGTWRLLCQSLSIWAPEPSSSGEASVLAPSPIHPALQAIGLVRQPYEPTQRPRTAPRSRQSFAAVPQAPQQLPSQQWVPKCCSEPARRRFGVACRVPG